MIDRWQMDGEWTMDEDEDGSQGSSALSVTMPVKGCASHSGQDVSIPPHNQDLARRPSAAHTSGSSVVAVVTRAGKQVTQQGHCPSLGLLPALK